MSTVARDEVLRDRLRAFLTFIKPKLMVENVDLDRLMQLRRVSDVRIRQFAVGRPQITAADLCELLADPKGGRFDAVADQCGLLRKGHFLHAIPSLGEQMGFVVECCLTLQVVGLDKMVSYSRAFVSQWGAVPAPTMTPAAAAANSNEPPPLPEPVQKLLGGVRDLWAIPAQTAKILQLLQASNSPAEAVCAEIEKDPGLSSQILRLVNSATYGLGTKIASIKRAVVTLGYPLTRRMVALSSLTSKLAKPHGELDFDFKGFWNRSLTIAHAASLVSRATKLGNPDEHFSAGLLHDIGTLVIYQYLQPQMKLIRAGAVGGAPAGDVEMRVLGCTAAEIGACFCEQWRFPPLISEAARHHNDPSDKLEELSLPREAMVVAALCRLVVDDDAPSPPDEATWMGYLGLPQAKVRETIEKARQLARSTSGEFAAA